MDCSWSEVKRRYGRAKGEVGAASVTQLCCWTRDRRCENRRRSKSVGRVQRGWRSSTTRGVVFVVIKQLSPESLSLGCCSSSRCSGCLASLARGTMAFASPRRKPVEESISLTRELQLPLTHRRETASVPLSCASHHETYAHVHAARTLGASSLGASRPTRCAQRHSM